MLGRRAEGCYRENVRVIAGSGGSEYVEHLIAQAELRHRRHAQTLVRLQRADVAAVDEQDALAAVGLVAQLIDQFSQ